MGDPRRVPRHSGWIRQLCEEPVTRARTPWECECEAPRVNVPLLESESSPLKPLLSRRRPWLQRPAKHSRSLLPSPVLNHALVLDIRRTQQAVRCSAIPFARRTVSEERTYASGLLTASNWKARAAAAVSTSHAVASSDYRIAPRAACPRGSCPRPGCGSVPERSRPWRWTPRRLCRPADRWPVELRAVLDRRPLRRARAPPQTTAARSALALLMDGWIRGPGRRVSRTLRDHGGIRAGLHPTISAARAWVTQASASAVRTRSRSSTEDSETRTCVRPDETVGCGKRANVASRVEACALDACSVSRSLEGGMVSTTRRSASAHRRSVSSEQPSRAAASGTDSHAMTGLFLSSPSRATFVIASVRSATGLRFGALRRPSWRLASRASRRRAMSAWVSLAVPVRP